MTKEEFFIHQIDHNRISAIESRGQNILAEKTYNVVALPFGYCI